MKSLAILQDSFREAVDSKVFSVMLVLSGVLMLVVGSMSFEPRPVAEVQQRLEYSLNRDLAQLGAQAPRNLKIVGAGPVNGATDRPESPFEFTVRAQFADAKAASAARSSPEPIQDYLATRFGIVDDWQMLAVTGVLLAGVDNRLQSAPPDAKDVHFDVVTRPTHLTLRLWPHTSTLLFGAVPLSATMMSLTIPGLEVKEVPSLGAQIWLLEDYLVGGLGAWVAILVSVVITAFFIPNMIRKGSVDLMLVKPIHRTTLLIYKYVGGLAFIFLNTTVAIGGVWLIVGLRAGVWSPNFLLVIPVITFFFAILYAVSALSAVWSRSAIVAILMTFLAWGVLYAVGRTYYAVEAARREGTLPRASKDSRQPQEWWVSAISAAHFVLPRTKDLDYLTTRLLTADLLPPTLVRELPESSATFNWTETLTVSGLFIAIMLALASWRFATRDY